MSPKARFSRNLGGPPYTATCGDLEEDVCKKSMKEDAYNYHRRKYGPNFAYDDFIPMFKAKKYDPVAWARLFKKAGAKYVVLTAKHGDEFALWPSRYTNRNAGDMGPHRDLVGELTRAVRNEGLKMGFYHNTTYSFWDERYPKAEGMKYMNNSIKELVDRYHPSILWGDVWTGPVKDSSGQPLGAVHWNSKELLAYFYNHSEHPDQVVANDRWGIDKNGKHRGDYHTPEGKLIEEIFQKKWETCNSLDPHSWGYNARCKEEEYMTVKEAVHYLVDIVSKNGNFLLNIGPRADGTIPELMKKRLLGIGRWLAVNGEAIYGTDYCHSFGECNIRFTRKGNNVLYAIALDWPGNLLHIKSLPELQESNIKAVKMLGIDKELEWSRDREGLRTVSKL